MARGQEERDEVSYGFWVRELTMVGLCNRAESLLKWRLHLQCTFQAGAAQAGKFTSALVISSQWPLYLLGSLPDNFP